MKAVFTFGRFQPPTIGHGLLIRKVVEIAAATGADPYVFVTSTQNKSKPTKQAVAKAAAAAASGGAAAASLAVDPSIVEMNSYKYPLPVQDKVDFLRKQYPDLASIFINTTEAACPRIDDVVYKLKQRYEHITIVLGSDYADKIETAEGTVYVKGDKYARYIRDLPVDHVEFLVRSKNSNLATGISGTKMRIAAVLGKTPEFRSGVMAGNVTPANANTLMQKIRNAYTPKGGRRKTRSRKARSTSRSTSRSRKNNL